MKIGHRRFLNNLSELVDSIYRVVKEGHEVTQEQADEFGKTLGDLIAQRLRDRKDNKNRKFTLRMSNIGKGARQLWYSRHSEETEEFSGQTLLKFILGDIVESLLLFLTTLTEHKVSALQSEVNLDGIKGHIDADIDGVTVDVKSASPHAFKKFANATLQDNDSFGYVEQLAGYCTARDTDGAFLAMDKVSGELAYLPFSRDELNVFDVRKRIEYIKQVIDKDEPPERCYEDEEFQTSGNRKLGVVCSYCQYKDKCWSDANDGIGLRKFIYSSGPVWLTHVEKEPRVYEVTF